MGSGRAATAAPGRLSNVSSTSAVIDLALDCLIRTERLRRDVEAYRRRPPTVEEADLASLPEPTALDDDTDWEALYADIEA
jgi:hypothetical protein